MHADIAGSAISNSATDDTAWAERSEFWLKKASTRAPKSSARRRLQEPLILTGHGVSLRVHQGTLIVRNGLTHYPQEQEQCQFFPGKWRLPSRIVVLDGKGALSFHALRWLAEHDIPLIHIDWRGDVVHVVGGTAHAIERKLVEAQLEAQKSGTGSKISQWLIAEKITNSLTTLRSAFPRSPAIDLAVEKIRLDAERIKRRPISSISDLLGIEGRVAAAYFGAWVSFPLKWDGVRHRSIPEDWKQIGPRASMATDKSHRNRHATHPVNAMLNYAYGVLEHQVRMQILAAGLDPTIGFLHGAYRNKPTLVYDLMEPLRPIVDRQVLEFIRRNVFVPDDFLINGQGVCRLNPRLAQNIVRLVDIHKQFTVIIRRVMRRL
jgi:CRISP-associated protein Cas1